MGRTVVLLMALLFAGCTAEVTHGPRLVHYSPNHFYVRHIPLRDPDGSIDRLAEGECGAAGKVAMLEQEQQYFPAIDIRYAIYRCTLIPPPAS